jgi:hypothetical protein
MISKNYLVRPTLSFIIMLIMIVNITFIIIVINIRVIIITIVTIIIVDIIMIIMNICCTITLIGICEFLIIIIHCRHHHHSSLGEIMRRDHSSLSLHSMGGAGPPVSSSSSAMAATTSAAAWGRGDAIAAAAAVAPSPPRSPQASPLAAAVGSVETQKVGSLEKFIERQLMQPRSTSHMKGAMSHADLSSLSKQPPLRALPLRVHVPLILNNSTVEQFIDIELHDRRKSSGSEGPAPIPHPLKFSENSLGYGRGDAVAAAAAAAAITVADATSQPLASFTRNSAKNDNSSSLNDLSLNLDAICEPSILPLTCSIWPDPALLERNYKEIPSSRTSFIPAYENNISTLMSELICQRLAGDFQLLADASAKVDRNK